MSDLVRMGILLPNVSEPERNPHPLTKVRDEWGVMFNDNSVLKGFNGKTAEKRAKAEAAKLREKFYPDNIRAVHRAVYVGPWEEVSDQSKEE